MSVLDRPTVTIAPLPARPHGTVATVAVVVGAVCAVVGWLTPAVEFYVPAAFGAVVIVLAIIGFEARGRAWAALVLGGLILAEAVYGVAQLTKVEHEFGSPVDTPRAGTIVNLAFGTTYDTKPLSIGLSRPVTYVPTPSATGRRTGRAVTFNIAVTNRDTRSFPVHSLTVQAFCGNTQDGDIEDSANNVGPSSAILLPGRSLVWQIAFAIPKDARDISIQIAATTSATVVFTGTL